MATTTMTSTKEQMITLVKQGFDHFLKGNIQAVLDSCTEDVNWGLYENPDIPFAKNYKGKEAIAQFFRDLDKSVNFNIFSPDKFYADEDMVFVKVHEAATVKPTGKNYDHQVLMAFKIRDGKICDYFGYGDTALVAKAFSK